MEKFNLISQGLNQLSFIGSLIGGFALSLAAGIISKSEKNKVASWTVGFAISVTSSMMVCVIGWSMASFRLYLLSANSSVERLESIGSKLDGLSEHLGLLFLASIFLFFVSLGLSGWNLSRNVGIATTTIAFLAAVAGVFVIIPFLG